MTTYDTPAADDAITVPAHPDTFVEWRADDPAEPILERVLAKRISPNPTPGFRCHGLHAVCVENRGWIELTPPTQADYTDEQGRRHHFVPTFREFRSIGGYRSLARGIRGAAGANRLAALQLYGATYEYAERLGRFCTLHGWEVHPNQDRRCLILLDNPTHRCSGQSCHGDGRRTGPDVAGRNLDHVVLLRRGTAARPARWAFLSQPYGSDDPSGRALRLGSAPYGHGTTALLYVGVGR